MLGQVGRSLAVSTQPRHPPFSRLCSQARHPVTAPSATPAATPQPLSASDFPQSREEAIEQAASAVTTQLTPSAKKLAKKKKKGKAAMPSMTLRKLSIEVPTADAGPSSQLELVSDILDRLPTAAGAFSVVFADSAAAELARQQDAPFAAYDLSSCFEEDIDGPVMIVETSYDDAATVERLLGSHWTGRACVLLNAAWQLTVPPQLAGFAKSFDTVYCFQPLSVKTFLGVQEGAVFKWVRQGNAGGTNWQLFVLQGENMNCVGQQARRPTTEDIETALYNAMAAESPITKGAKWLRGLTSGGNKQ